MGGDLIFILILFINSKRFKKIYVHAMQMPHTRRRTATRATLKAGLITKN